MSIGEWSAIVHDEMNTFLRLKLSEDDFDDKGAREEALEEQLSWFWQHHNKMVEDATARGRGGTLTRKILHPIIQMVRQLSIFLLSKFINSFCRSQTVSIERQAFTSVVTSGIPILALQSGLEPKRSSK